MVNKNEKKSNAIIACEFCGMRFSGIEELKSHEKMHETGESDIVHEKVKIEKNVFESPKTAKTEGKIQWGSFTVTFVLAVLVSISAMQAYESYNIMQKIQSGNIASASGPAVPASIENLPNMVGGC